MSLFVSHGSPMLAVEDCSARRFFQAWHNHHKEPIFILVVSAHWEHAGGPVVGMAEWPETLHDFGGFPRELYSIRYPVPGAPNVAQQAVALLRGSGFHVMTDAARGLDHGAWVPLGLLYPDADIPVFQVSLIHGAGPEEHYRLGVALQSLHDLGGLIVGSGSLTHNLYEYMGHEIDDAPPHWVTDFERWMKDNLEAGRIADVLNYRALAPYAVQNHPSEEHLLPLFVALGAAGNGARGVQVHASHTYGVISMGAYVFHGAGDVDPV